MKKTRMTVLCAVLSGSLLCTSCIGSFSLWNNLKDWNQSIGNKFVNEVVFLAFHLIPVYEVAYIADVIVLNSVEFWSGSNPLADVGKVKTVKGENGEYMVRTNEDGTITFKQADGTPMTVSPDLQGLATARAASGQSLFLAAR